jgi:hypothetical protein
VSGFSEEAKEDKPKLKLYTEELKYANFNAKQLSAVTEYFEKLKNVHKV